MSERTARGGRPDPVAVKARADRLVDRVTDALASPGTRAALRRSLGRPPEHVTAVGAHAVVAPYLPDVLDYATERAFYTVAALIAVQSRAAREQGLDDGDETDASTDPEPSAGERSPQEAAHSVPDHSGQDSADAVDAETTAEPARDGPKAHEFSQNNLGFTLARAVATGKLNPHTTESRLHLLCRQDIDGLHRHMRGLVGHLRAHLVLIDWTALIVDLSRCGTDRDRVAKEWLQSYHRTLNRAGEPSSPDPAAPSTTSESEDQ